MAYNNNDKITLQELSPSLQNLILNAAKQTEIDELSARVNKLIILLYLVGFSVVDDLSEIMSPTNGGNLAVAKDNGVYKLYFYNNDKWNYIPTATIDLNKEYTINIHQVDHQTITVEYNGNYYTESFKAKVNSELHVSIRAEEGYNPGSLTCPETFTVVDTVHISANGATKIPDYKITVTAKAHQTILITCNGENYVNKSVTGVRSNSLFTVAADADYGFNVGAIQVGDNAVNQYENTYMIVGNTTVTLANATRKNYNVTVQGTKNQEITFKYVDANTSTVVTKIISTLTQTYSIPYGSTYTVTATGKNGYLPGTLSTTSGTVTADFSISISSAVSVYNKEIFDTPGEYIWTAPSYITKVHVIINGAGGGAHSEIIEQTSESIGYFNGGNGDQEDHVVQVVAGRSYTLKVGNKGVTFVTDGEFSSAFNITAPGGGVNGVDAGNGLGGRGDTIEHLTGHLIERAENGSISLEYGTIIEQEEVG